MNQRQFKLIQSWYCLAPGTILHQDQNGNYLVYQQADQWSAGHFLNRYIGLSGGLVESRSDVFEEITTGTI